MATAGGEPCFRGGHPRAGGGNHPGYPQEKEIKKKKISLRPIFAYVIIILSVFLKDDSVGVQ